MDSREKKFLSDFGIYRTDFLQRLQRPGKLNDKLAALHQALRQHFPFVDRVAVALLDRATSTLTTFLASNGGGPPLKHYERPIEEAPALLDVLDRNQPRVLNDLSVFDAGQHEHTAHIRAQGYQSSYTFPMNYRGNFEGFIFFNSNQKNVFLSDKLDMLDVWAHLITQISLADAATMRTILAVLTSFSQLFPGCEPPPEERLQRISHYSRLIARELARSGQAPLDDEFIESLFFAAPLYDIGNIGIPDQLLRKSDGLSEMEEQVVRLHPLLGRQLLDAILEKVQLESFQDASLLRHVVEHHHETLDGLGYPRRLRGQEIPLVARIMGVADRFETLTRGEGQTLGNAEALERLRRMAETKLDHSCVEALERNLETVLQIQQAFDG